jgi:hypothetical protein
MSRYTNRNPKQHRPGVTKMSDLEKILASHKMELERQTKLLAKRVKDLGYDGLTDQEFSIAIADNYFGPNC